MFFVRLNARKGSVRFRKRGPNLTSSVAGADYSYGAKGAMSLVKMLAPFAPSQQFALFSPYYARTRTTMG